MKLIVFVILSFVLMLSSCVSHKSTTRSETRIAEFVDSAKVVNNNTKYYVDTTKKSSSVAEVIKIEFFDPVRNAKEFKTPAEDPGDDDEEEGGEDYHHRWPPGIKSIEYKKINRHDQESGVIHNEMALSDSSKYVSQNNNDSKTYDKKKPVVPWWRWVIFVIVIITGLFFVIRCLNRKE